MRRIAIFGVTLIAIIGAGYVSNPISRPFVEQQMLSSNLDTAKFTSNLWHLPPTEFKQVPRQALRWRAESQARAITFQTPPAVDPPFAYAYAESFLPFLLRVHAGWAVSGRRMAFGEGGDLYVVSLFGVWSRIIKKQPHWSY